MSEPRGWTCSWLFMGIVLRWRCESGFGLAVTYISNGNGIPILVCIPIADKPWLSRLKGLSHEQSSALGHMDLCRSQTLLCVETGALGF